MPDIFTQDDVGQEASDANSAVDQTRSVFTAQPKEVSVTREKVVVKPKYKPPTALGSQEVTPITSSKSLHQSTQPLDVASAELKAKQDPPDYHPVAPETGERVGLVKHVDEYSEVMRKEKPTKSRFHAYVPKPPDVTFASQVPKEQIILVLRQHPITQWKKVLTVIGMILGYFFLSWLGFFDFLTPSYYVGMTLFWFLIVVGYSFATFLKWLYNMYIITDERIIDVDVYSLLKRNLTSAKIDHVQDVTAANYGLLGSIFNVGIVVVQTAGAHPMLEFGGVPHPARVVTLINELLLEEEREKIEGRVT